MNKLWAVTIERTILVVAEEPESAKDLACRSQHSELCNDPDSTYAREIHDPRAIPEEWRGSSPYGPNGGMSCERFLESTKSVPTSKPNEVI